MNANTFWKNIIAIIFVLNSTVITAQEYMIGADLSFAKEAEENGFVFKEDNNPKKVVQIFKGHGYNWVRLQLFHTPSLIKYIVPNNLEYTINFAKEAKKKGYKFLLDYHYSFTWADPSKQYVSKAWEVKTQKEAEQLVFEYTKKTLIAFRDANVYPDMVKVGNKISNGVIWPYGKLPENWDNFAALI
jgi:arabinogalactan endo-1,4-beta-galactosidase